MVDDGPDELLKQLCQDLRLLWTQAGGPSLRILSARIGLGKSQVGAILNGEIRRPPDWRVVRTLIESCRDHARDHDRMARVSLRTGVDEYWRPRHAMIEHAFRQPRTDGPGRATGTPTPVRPGSVPRQLPLSVRQLAGRTGELATMDALADRNLDPGTPATVVTIDGTAGIGKTALAAFWARRAAGRFPDGQLYADLGGFTPDGGPVPPHDVVRGFLGALGVPPGRIPDGPAEQVALYRSLLADRRVLVVLDNARDSRQSRPLLPSGTGCLVVVTSRNRLTGLVAAEGAHPITLDLLAPDEARELLARRIGPDRVAAEPAAVDEIVERCARLPLALAIVAAGAVTRPALPLAAFAAQLRQAPDPLAELAGADREDPRTVISWSYRALTAPAARLFRLLGLHPGPAVTPPAAASLAGVPVEQVRPLLAELTDAHLLAEQDDGRYWRHDLLHAYAIELTRSRDGGEVRAAALRRLLDHLLHSAYAAATLVDPNRSPIEPVVAAPGAVTLRFADLDEALAWSVRELPVLLAAVRRAAESRLDAHAWQLTWACEPVLQRQGGRHDWVALQEVALDAARRLDDPLALAHAHRGLARAHTGLDRHADAHAHHRAALDLFERIGQPADEAYTNLSLSLVYERQGRHREALRHSRRSLVLFRRAGHRPGQARALNGLGWQHALLGEYEQALACCQRALTLLTEVGDVIGQAQTWDSIGFAEHHLGRQQRAIDCFLRALELIRAVGDRNNEAEMLVHLGDAQFADGATGAARTSWRRALHLLDHLDHADADAVRARLQRSPGDAE
ncbi:tetratricopeptide repeat protein [Solwaraspora sp. WMMD1047]|uniref:ATP-binding protein n=1 Tax=Solwaraspora sp. WMMD1047 TaxID=3016102 RepID=UPI002415B04C|nr:tetratricopeptide repeat protein [Solwaraspora sp. WMMD1047]MDG4828188.1 tetratricopeptide repeat protein [Solwaraspora sp. WMMD1047]